MKSKIMIVGGYGTVGSVVSEKLCALYPGQIIIAGRRFDKAQALSYKLNNKAIPYQFDVNNWKDGEIMQQVKLVVMCIDVPSTDFVRYCISRGIHYIDITPTSGLTGQIEMLDTHAVENHVSIVLSVGIAPGITNLLARHALNERPDLKEIDIYVLFGLGEKHGAAGYQWIFENIEGRYPLAGREKGGSISGFSLPKETELLGRRTFYSFNFADQHSLLKTTDAQQIITRLGFDVKLVANLIYALKRMRLLKLLLSKPMQKLILKSANYGKMGSDIYGIKVVGHSERESYECSVIGNSEVNITAFVTTEVAKLIYEQSLPSGVFHINQIVKDIPVFFTGLKKYDNELKVNI